ncbi:MAG TPA: 16S rRNA (guanine(527)-N(7))-methyltransferase RsmG, partial [Solirubrobacteraceae bacterium]|nr:16S rRNA (guanine(527)-N(7))-methyltransferase RsmG [Solirubrobacteraceae bacterium]
MTVSRATSAARLDQLAEQYGLSPEQRDQLAAILAELDADTHAPTTVRAPDDAVDVHLADSLAALALSELTNAATVVDIGSGAGFPGLPLAVALPGATFSLVESQARKCAFLRRVCRAAKIANATAVCVRVEELPQSKDAFDAALARAVGTPSVMLEYAAPLLRRGGALVDWRASLARDEEAAAARAADELGLELSGVHEAAPFPGASARTLYLYTKV